MKLELSVQDSCGVNTTHWRISSSGHQNLPLACMWPASLIFDHITSEGSNNTKLEELLSISAVGSREDKRPEWESPADLRHAYACLGNSSCFTGRAQTLSRKHHRKRTE